MVIGDVFDPFIFTFNPDISDDILGCTDMGACNYDQDATDDDGSCEYESCSGCMDMSADNYDMDATIPCDGCCEYPPATFNVYRDGTLVASDIESFDYVDGGLENATQYCYIVELVDGGEVLGSSNEACATTDEQSLQHFTDLPIETGTSSLVIIQNIDGLVPGDEVGLFDANGITNYGDCADETGNILVGAGVWTGSQLNLVGVGSVDLCDFGGVQLSGAPLHPPVPGPKRVYLTPCLHDWLRERPTFDSVDMPFRLISGRVFLDTATGHWPPPVRIRNAGDRGRRY